MDNYAVYVNNFCKLWIMYHLIFWGFNDKEFETLTDCLLKTIAPQVSLLVLIAIYRFHMDPNLLFIIKRKEINYNYLDESTKLHNLC